MGSVANRKKGLKTIGNFFLEKGKILTLEEYNTYADRPIRASSIRAYYGVYARMVSMLEKNEPELYASILNVKVEAEQAAKAALVKEANAKAAAAAAAAARARASNESKD